MKKLTLNAEDLQVNSFQTGQAAESTINRATFGQWTCGIYCPNTTNPQVTGPCAC